MTIRFSRLADLDLEGIYHYIADHSSDEAAQSVVRSIEGTLHRLADFPHVGRSRGDLSPGLRSIPVQSYLIQYRIENDDVYVVRIAYGSQDMPALLG